MLYIQECKQIYNPPVDQLNVINSTTYMSENSLSFKPVRLYFQYQEQPTQLFLFSMVYRFQITQQRFHSQCSAAATSPASTETICVTVQDSHLHTCKTTLPWQQNNILHTYQTGSAEMQDFLCSPESQHQVPKVTYRLAGEALVRYITTAMRHRTYVLESDLESCC